MVSEEFKEGLELHKKWLDTDGKEGKRADLRGSDLHGSNFSEGNFSEGNFSKSDLSGSNFSGSNFGMSYFSGSNFSGIMIDEKACKTLGGKVVEGVCKAEIKLAIISERVPPESVKIQIKK